MPQPRRHASAAARQAAYRSRREQARQGELAAKGLPEQVDAWHAAGCAAGGKSCEDPPGWRENAFGKLYLAYLRDPDGNKLCGLHRPAQ